MTRRGHIDTEKVSISTPGQSRNAELTYDDRMATTKKNKGLPQQPLIAQYYVNLSANFLKLLLTDPLSTEDENVQNAFCGKF